MKTSATTIGSFPITDDTHGIIASFNQFARRAGKRLHGAMVEMQVARMESVIASLPDEHLAFSGQSRDELKAQARYLVTGSE